MFKARKVGWSDQGRRGLYEGGGNCLKYCTGEWSRREGRGNKDFKKGGGKLGQAVGALKRVGAGTPLQMVMLRKKQKSFCEIALRKILWIC